MAARSLPGLKSPTTGADFALMRGAGPRWTGDVEMIRHKLPEPLSWRTPRRCFVNSMSDLGHPAITHEQRAAAYGVMAVTPHITYQILTKRPGVMRDFYEWADIYPVGPPDVLCQRQALEFGADVPLHPTKGTIKAYPWPLPNVWLGVSAENQETADARIPVLLECPAAIRFLSYEPALGPMDFTNLTVQTKGGPEQWNSLDKAEAAEAEPAAPKTVIDWVIAGGESGPGARPAHPQWFRDVRDQCQSEEMPYFFKQ